MVNKRTRADLSKWRSQIQQGAFDRALEAEFTRNGDILWRSKLLEFYAQRSLLRDRSPDLTEKTVYCPPQFSFIDAPDAAMEMLQDLVLVARDGARRVVVDQAQCLHLDLCAATALNVLALDAAENVKTVFTGKYPVSQEAREIVASTGLPKLLRAQVPDVPDVIDFKLRHGGPNPRLLLLRPSRQEQVSTDLARYLDKCLGLYNWGFKPAGLEYMGRLAGEVIGNAEDHAPEWPWYVAAYLRQPKSKSYGDCHLVFLNFGNTISESLQLLPAGNELRRTIEDLIALHTTRQFFRPDWTEEELWTLYALQEYVTRHFGSENVASRGVGTADMIEAFQVLGKSSQTDEPRMCLVSGRTQIIFDMNSSHRMVRVDRPGGQARLIAFNAANDLTQPPDAECVRHLRNYFPGTLISLRFFLDEKYLGQLHGKKNN